MTKIPTRMLVGLALIGTTISALAQNNTPDASESDFRKISDIHYAVVDGQELKLDLYLPANVSRPSLLHCLQ